MNKAFRIIWSVVRHAFVVVDELTSTRGKRSRARLLLAGMGAGWLALSGTAMAASDCGGSSPTIVSGQTLGSTCWISNGASLTVQAGGAISTTGSYTAVRGDSATTHWGTLSNAGSITATDSYAISFSAGSGTSFYNQSTGLISGSQGGVQLLGGNGEFTLGSFTNAGTIRSTFSYGSAVRLTDGVTLTGDLNNSGLIEGNFGVNLFGSVIEGDLVNTASGKILGQEAGIWVGNGGRIEGVLRNSGTISGASAIKLARDSEGGDEGVFIGGLDNSGLIQGNDVGIEVADTTINGELLNRTGGRVEALEVGILFSGESTLGVLRNNGTITSNYSAVHVGMGVHVQSIENTGTITGGAFGIRIDPGARVESITNSGTLGSYYAISADPAALGKLIIAGNDTARFIGGVDILGADVELQQNATYTLLSDASFLVKNFINAGTLGVLANASSGRLVIEGDYTQTSSGTLRLGVADDSHFARLHINGTATLGSDAKIAVDVTNPNYRFTSQQLSNVFSATDLVSDGTFAVTDNSKLFDFGAIKNGNAINLTLTTAASSGGSGVESVVRGMGNSPAFAAAGVLDRALANNPTGELAGHFVGLTSDQQVSDAVTQTLPLLTGGSTGATSNTLSGINRVIQARQDSNSGLSSGDEASTEKNLWLKSFGSWADQNERSGVSGFDANTKGFALGADSAVSDSTRLGMAFAYARTTIDSDSRIAPQDAQIDTFQLIGYGSYALAPDTELNFQVDAGQNRNEGKRRMPFADAVAKADYDSYSAHAGVGLGHTLRFGQDLSFVPSVRADYTWIGEEAYHETGAGALNLDIDSRDAEELIFSVDGKLNYSITPSTVLSANVGVGYDVINEQSSITSTYAGAPGAAFSTRGLNPEPWLGRVGLGLSHTLPSGTEVSLRYDAESRSDFLNQGASIKARWAF